MKRIGWKNAGKEAKTVAIASGRSLNGIPPHEGAGAEQIASG